MAKMKYIRTKNKIYEISELSKCEDIRFLNGYFTKYGVPLVEIKQADTIEELCDEFVTMCVEYEKPFAWSNHHNEDSFKKVKDFYDFWGKKDIKHLQFLYGAIWTSKGLIYVAKMNDKGELELL